MKKILFIALMLTVNISLVGKDFNNQQLSLRLEIVKFLSAEGFKPIIDQDGDVKFTHDDAIHFFIINENWNEPYLVTLYCGYSYDDENYTENNLKSFISAVAQNKVVKLYCGDTFFAYRSDIFCENIDIIISSFYSILNEMDTARKNVTRMLAAGLGGIDITNDKETVFEKALNYYENENYAMSFQLFSYLAESGFEKASGFVGLAYELGEGVSKNEDLMEKYYEKAINSGYSWCAYRLGTYHYRNENYKDALKNLIKCGANENGFRSDALYLAGTMYENGEGTAKSITQAIKCYKKSVQYATELECDARLALMRMGETIENEDEFTEATKSMLMGLSPSEMYEKGEEYEYGLNHRYVSLTKAYAYYKAAADEGYTKAECKMGDIYISKYYPFNNESKSNKYYSKALKKYKKKAKSDGDACYELGNMFYGGHGIEKDIEQAKYYYKSGALMGNIDAAWRLGIIYKDEMEYPEAYKFLLKAAEGGQGMAMYELAKLYENGLGTAYNKDEAIRWYKKCSESPYRASEEAAEALERLNVNDEKI